MYPVLKRFFRHLKPIELAVRGAKRRCRDLLRCLLAPGRVRAYLAENGVRKLHLGAGGIHLPGWLNTDIDPVDRRFVRLDATRRFPVPDAAFDYVFAEHQIEHLSYAEGYRMLRECFRVLRPGGRIRLGTPNLQVILGLYPSPGGDTERRYIEWSAQRFRLEKASAAFIVNNMFRNWGHRFIYDRDTLRQALEEAGFVECAVFAPQESGDAHLRGLEGHARVVGEEFNLLETLILEAKRPG